MKPRSKTKPWTLLKHQIPIRTFSQWDEKIPGFVEIDLIAFINAHLLMYCNENKITFTRTRPYRKNDNCYVEQKNWSVVRKAVGYLRYDKEEKLNLLNELYEWLRLWTNFFQPVMKLNEKTRKGSKVKKKYDEPKTPYQRIIESSAYLTK